MARRCSTSVRQCGLQAAWLEPCTTSDSDGRPSSVRRRPDDSPEPRPSALTDMAIDECARETGRRGEVFSALNHENRNSEVTGERSRIERACLRKEALATEILTIEPVVDIAQRGARRSQSEDW